METEGSGDKDNDNDGEDDGDGEDGGDDLDVPIVPTEATEHTVHKTIHKTESVTNEDDDGGEDDLTTTIDGNYDKTDVISSKLNFFYTGFKSNARFKEQYPTSKKLLRYNKSKLNNVFRFFFNISNSFKFSVLFSAINFFVIHRSDQKKKEKIM